MKKILTLIFILTMSLTSLSVSASDLLGDTDYFSDLPEWEGDMALNENEWNETPSRGFHFIKQAVTI